MGLSIPGRAVTRAGGEWAQLILAPNPGPMTLQGTNTWIVGDPGRGPVLVVDPGPADEAHLDRIVAAAGDRIAAILITHRHADHTEGAAGLAARASCPVRAVDPRCRVGDAGLDDREVLETAGASLTVIHTPGHTSDSVCFLLETAGKPARLLTGDTVLGEGTTVITEPDGDLGAYLESMAVLQRVVAERGVRRLLPGHGPVIEDPAAVLDYYVRHRLERLDQVRAALAAGDRTAAEVVARVYADVDRSVWPAAEQSVRAQLRYLAKP